MPAGIRVQTITPSGTGYDLTDQCEGLSWSSTNPGGDELCSFSLKRKWFAGAPEVSRGNTVRITAGLDVLWQGTIDENDRSVADAEQIGIAANGKGIALKDDATYREVIVDRDLSHWIGASVQERINRRATGTFAVQDSQVQPDTATGAPSLAQQIDQQPWAITGEPLVEAWYDAGPGLAIGSLYYAWKKNGDVNAGDANWHWVAALATDDVATTSDTSGELRAAGPSSGTLAAGGSNRRYANLNLYYGAASAGAAGGIYALYWTCLAVYGNHGLTKSGSESATDAKGFLASTVVPYIVAKVGLTARRVDATTFVIPQLAWLTGVTHEQAITDTVKFEQVDWGTWGPSSALDTSTGGYFDMTARDPTTQHWLALRSECDNVALNVETATLYDTVDVAYTDAAGVASVVTRTQTAPDLTRSRKTTLQGGTLTTAGAQQLGDAFLALSGGYAPARGSVTISQPVTHYRRGRIAPWYMRADGSNLRLPDVLPSKDLFSLSSTPDRRTTFPIKRVSVDCSGAVPKVTAELDQSNDTLAVLQAQLQAAAQAAVGK